MSKKSKVPVKKAAPAKKQPENGQQGAQETAKKEETTGRPSKFLPNEPDPLK